MRTVIGLHGSENRDQNDSHGSLLSIESKPKKKKKKKKGKGEKEEDDDEAGVAL